MPEDEERFKITKIIITMNRHETWEAITQKNQLTIENFKISNKYIADEEENKFHENLIQFNLNRSGEIITHVTQHFYLESLSDIPITKTNYYSVFDYFIENIRKYKLYQKLYITYVSENEDRLFNLEIGDPLVIIEKKMTNNGELIFYEEELSRCDKYFFQEVNNGV